MSEKEREIEREERQRERRGARRRMGEINATRKGQWFLLAANIPGEPESKA